jgi:peptidoglycan hydrolase CwlO-like protein
MATPTSPSASGAKDKRNKLIITGMAVAIVLLLAGVAWFVYDNSQISEENVKLTSEKENLENEIQSLDKEIKQMEIDLQKSDQDKEALQQQLLSLQDKIAYYKVQVNKLIKEGKLAEEEKEKFKGKYEQLEYINGEYRKKIAELEREINELKTENTDLKQAVQTKEKQLSEVADENTKYRIKIKAGSRLAASEINVSGQYENGKEKEPEKNTLKAKKLRRLKVSGRIAANPIATEGRRDLFLVVKSAVGRLYTSPANAGLFKLNDKEMSYSSRTAINYRGETDFVILLELAASEQFDKGPHDVFLYTTVDENSPDTYLLGKTSITLK